MFASMNENTDVGENDRGGRAPPRRKAEEKWQEGGKVTVNERRFNVTRLRPSHAAMHMHEVLLIYSEMTLAMMQL